MGKEFGLGTALALGALSYLFVTSDARAGNDDEVLMGSDATLMGGAVTAIVDDGSALWYNPAGLGARGKNQLKVSGSAYTLRIYNIPEYLESPDGKTVNANTTEFVTLPTAVTFARSINPKWTVAAGYFLSKWSDVKGHSELRFDDEGGDAVWQIGYLQTDVQHNFVIGTSFKTNDTFSFGASLIGMYKSFIFARESSGGISTVPEDPNSNFITSSEQGSQSHGGVQAVLGVQWKPDPAWRVGLSLRSPALGIYHSYEQHGYDTSGIDLDQVDTVSPAPGEPSRQLRYITETEAFSEFRPDWILPARFRLGIAQVLERFTWSVDVDYQSAVQSRVKQLGNVYFQAVNRKSVVNARIGGKYKTSDMTRIGLGVFTDRGGERNKYIGTGRLNFYGIALGAELGDIYKVKDKPEVDKLRFSTTLGLRYAVGFGQLGKYEVPEFYTLVDEFVNGGPNRIGTTSATAHEITANLGAGLFF